MSFVIITKIYRTVVTLPSSSSCNKEKQPLTNVAWYAENWEIYTYLLESPEEWDHLGHKGGDGMMILVLKLEAETQCEDVNWIQVGHNMMIKECFSEQSDEHECNRKAWNYSAVVRGGAGKSLARPGRKHATKLGIYSTHSPRSSIHFLVHYSNFCKPLKKNSEGFPSNQVSTAAMTFQLFFQSSEQVVVRRGQIRRIGWVITTLEAQVGQFLLGCKCPVSWGTVTQEQDPLGDLPTAFFLQNVLPMHQQRWVILCIDSLALWKIINEEDAVLIPKNWGEKFSSGFLHLDFFFGGGSRIAAAPLIVAFTAGHSDITRFCPWSPIATGNHLDCAEKFQKLLRRLALLTFWSAFRHFGTHFAESFLMSKSSWMMDPTRSHEMPSCSAIDLAEIWQSSRLAQEFHQ